MKFLIELLKIMILKYLTIIKGISVIFIMILTSETYSQKGVIIDEIIAKVDNHIVLKSELELAYLDILASTSRAAASTFPATHSAPEPHHTISVLPPVTGRTSFRRLYSEHCTKPATAFTSKASIPVTPSHPWGPRSHSESTNHNLVSGRT